MGRIKGQSHKRNKNVQISEMIEVLHKADPKCRYDAEYYENNHYEFWARLKEEYQNAVNLSLVLTTYSLDYLRRVFRQYGFVTKQIDYNQLAEKMGWKTYILGLSDIYKYLPASKISALIEGYTGKIIHSTAITRALNQAGCTMRPRGGAHGVKRILADKYMNKIKSIEGYENMTYQEIIDATQLKRSEFRHAAAMFNFKYKKRVFCKTTQDKTCKQAIGITKRVLASTLWG